MSATLYARYLTSNILYELYTVNIRRCHPALGFVWNLPLLRQQLMKPVMAQVMEQVMAGAARLPILPPCLDRVRRAVAAEELLVLLAWHYLVAHQWPPCVGSFKFAWSCTHGV